MEMLNNLWMQLQTHFVQLGDVAAKFALVGIIALAGWLIAKAIRIAVVKALRTINFHILTQRSGLDALLQSGGSRQIDTTAILGLLAYWLAILATLVLICDSLGLMHVTDVLRRIAMFLPHVILAVVILVFGAYFSGVVDGAVVRYGKNIGLDEAAVLGHAARYVVLIFIVLIALDQLDIGADLIRYTFLIILGGLVLTLALAFGLGGQKWAAALLERWRITPEQKQKDDTDGKR